MRPGCWPTTAFNSTAQPTKFPAGFFHMFTGSYDLRAAHCEVTAVYTNKAPGGVAYACSFRITEAVYLVERLVDLLAGELGADPAELRMKNLLRPEQFPYTCPTGWEYDSGDYPRALRLAMDIAGYPELRREQAAKRQRGEYMGIGISFFTEGVGAGPRKHMDILGLGMADGADLRVHPTGKAVLAVSCQTQGQGHETTFAQIVAEELGLSPDDVDVVHGDTDRTPFGLGTYGSRSTPVSGAAAAVVARKVRERARIIAAAMLEVSPLDLTWADGKWQVRGDPEKARGIAEIAMAAHGALELPDSVEGHLDAETVYNPPNLTFPFGAYICVTDVDPGTGMVKVRRFIAVDDCGVRINTMIVEGQVHGGLADGIGMALMQVMAFDEAATAWADRSWITCCRPRWSARPGSSARRSRHRRTIRSGPRASASRPLSGHPLPSSTRCSTRCARSASGTPTCRSLPRTCGVPCRAARCAPTWRSRAPGPGSTRPAA